MKIHKDKLTVEQVELIARTLARKAPLFNELISDFTKGNKDILQGCLSMPAQKYKGKSVYLTLAGKAAVLFYSLAKKQPFPKGNKRIAVATLLSFLFINKQWIKTDPEVFHNLTVWVCDSPADAEQEVVQYIEKFLKKHMVPLED